MKVTEQLENGEYVTYESVSKTLGKVLKPDFLSAELGLIVEIDGDSIGKVGGHFCSTEKAIIIVSLHKELIINQYL